MTPALVKKIKQLVADGATVLGPAPTASPGLSDFPKCDEQVAKLSAEVWGDCDGRTVTEHVFGKGRVIWGQPLKDVLEKIHSPADFTSSVKLNWIHRQVGDTQVYFVANEKPLAVEAQCIFQVKGLRPELWNPGTGEISSLAMYEETNGTISLPLRLEQSGSCFVVFRPQKKRFDSVVDFTRNGQPVVQLTRPPVIRIKSATYGVPGDATRTRDVTAKLQMMVNGGNADFQVAKLAEGDDPAYGIVKTLIVDYTMDGDLRQASGKDPEEIHLAESRTTPERAAEIRCGANGKMSLVAHEPGRYQLKTAGGTVRQVEIASVPAPQQIIGPWEIHFPPKWGAPPEITLDHLISLSDSTNPGVKYFSGTATYLKAFNWNPASNPGSPKSEYWLNLGDVQVMAQAKLNGHDLGVVWKSPFRVNVTNALKPGRNTLEIRVADLWPNRMIGDAALPVAERFTWSSYEPFTKDSPLPKSGLLGPVMIETAQAVTLP